MTKVYTEASMSLDGYISGPGETGFEHLFKWSANGDVVVPTTHPELTLRMSAASAEQIQHVIDFTGALVVGRRLFDSTDAWGGNHPMGRPVVVVTHSVPEGWPREEAPFTFVTDGIESAIEKAKALAGDKMVGVNGGTIARQCLNAGLPVLLGGGTPFFDQLEGAPIELEGPTSVVEGIDVTHLRYRVRHP
jgi:dihydrofolate reductase